MLREALSYPLREPDVVLAGGGLHLLAVYVPVLPLVPVVGYLVGVLGRRAEAGRYTVGDDRPSPPGLRSLDLRRLVVDGVLGSLVAALYLALPTTLLLVTLQGVVTLGDLPTGPARFGILAVSTATLVVSLAVVYLLPAALAAYATRRRLRAAFDRSVLRRAAGDGEYFVAVLFSAAVLAVAAAGYGPLNAVALGFFLAAFAELTAAGLCGRGASAAVRAATGDEPAAAPGPE